MPDKNVHDAWNTFWERQPRSSGKGSGCLPQGWSSIDEVRAAVWKRFAEDLAEKARVLDLATGDGLVLAHMLSARPDLETIGIDRATALPQAPRGITLQGGVSMEDLPFEDDSFATITSQFGFEYGDVPKVAAEAARVLKPGGTMALITHRSDGPIVAHNRKRGEQVAWAIREQDLPSIACQSLALRNAGITDIPPAIAEAPARGAAAHGERSAAWEIAEAIRRTMLAGQREGPEYVRRVLDTIVMQAENELGRIASLELAASTASDHESFLGAIADAGFELVDTLELHDNHAPTPFADFRIFKLG